MWLRWNQSTHILEKSLDLGLIWTQLDLDGSIISEGQVAAARIANLAESQITNLVSDLALKAPLASPALTGAPTAPTASGGDNSTKLSTTAFVIANSARVPVLVSTLTDGSTPALDASLVSSYVFGKFRLAAAGDRTIGIPTNPTDGQSIRIEHFASGGARTLALNAGTGGFNLGAISLTQTASGKTDYIDAVYNTTLNKWCVINYQKGY